MAIPASVPIRGHIIVEIVFIWEAADAIGVMKRSVVMIMSSFGRERGVMWWVCLVILLSFVRAILYGRFLLLVCVGLVIVWGGDRHSRLYRDRECRVYMTNWIMCRVAIVVVTCSGMVVQKRAVSGRIRSALYGSRTADAVPSAEGWWKDKVCVMYSVTIILIISIAITDR